MSIFSKCEMIPMLELRYSAQKCVVSVAGVFKAAF